ncbi:MAG: crotonase/enoyl-CoA hydratase family protein [Myxococcales bacterium]|nr:crotonase/enoyl-CoA hydratase family protein [Myxococcales bacterium]
MGDRVLIDIDGGVAHVRLNRPDKHNALDPAMFRALADAGRQVAANPSIRAAVLSGEGKSFCAGLDFASFLGDQPAMQALLERNPDESPANGAQRAAWVWQEVPVPVIAAVRGVAFGGGFQIALGADLRYLAPDARLSAMELKWGLVPDMAITQTLLGLVRRDIARELLFTGRIVEATEAKALGLATRLSDDPLQDALETARLIATKSPHAIRAAKRLLRDAEDRSRADALLLETELQLPLLGSPNAMEAVQANMQKRQPRFSDPDAE